ncbi:A disintegrin and metalloproteinase with thrombospondin motifs 15 [Branchiostoma belcheri]|nr:A disintegrin and metalloproteinase with thrombospondin motifs 15 [Branchiostoma belcheri]
MKGGHTDTASATEEATPAKPHRSAKRKQDAGNLKQSPLMKCAAKTRGKQRVRTASAVFPPTTFVLMSCTTEIGSLASATGADWRSPRTITPRPAESHSAGFTPAESAECSHTGLLKPHISLGRRLGHTGILSKQKFASTTLNNAHGLQRPTRIRTRDLLNPEQGRYPVLTDRWHTVAVTNFRLFSCELAAESNHLLCSRSKRVKERKGRIKWALPKQAATKVVPLGNSAARLLLLVLNKGKLPQCSGDKVIPARERPGCLHVRSLAARQRQTPVTGNAASTLRNFCSWQQQQNTADDAHPAHHDTAVLLTRQDLCSSRDVCSTLGLAEVGTMCESHRSCSISQDNGLSAAFTIAHEIGHVFNMQHDSHRSCATVLAREGRYNLMAPTLNGDSTHPWAWSRCSSRALSNFLQAAREGRYNLMAPTLNGDSTHPWAWSRCSSRALSNFLQAAREGRYNLMAPTLNGDSTHPWAWSRCSSRALSNFLQTGRGGCLHDQPTGPGRKLPRDHPGQLFDVDQQCELVFGTGSSLCPFMRGTTCAKLWCTTMVKGQQVCQTYHMPWADGTACGRNRWCQEGKCTEKREAVRVDGGWGSWEPWGSCSRTCGGGVQAAARKCDSPAPQHGGDFCRGEAAKYRSCRTEACRGNDGKDTFRDRAETVQRSCTDRAEIVQRLCKDRAEIVHRPSRDRAETVQRSCTDRAEIVQRLCKDRAEIVHRPSRDRAEIKEHNIARSSEVTIPVIVRIQHAGEAILSRVNPALIRPGIPHGTASRWP